MHEISLHILDLVQNSIKAQATLVEIIISVDTNRSQMLIEIKDNGIGMTPDILNKICDPFFSTRTTRTIGLGVPLFKMVCEMTGGSFGIKSKPGAGTIVTALLNTAHIDCLPLGDIEESIFVLVTTTGNVDFIYRINYNSQSYIFETEEIKKILGDISLTEPLVSQYIRNSLKKNSPLQRDCFIALLL